MAYGEVSTANKRAYWKLEDVNDSGPNSYTLADNGTVPFVNGFFGLAADLERDSSQYFSRTTQIIQNATMTISCWVKPESTPSGGARYGVVTERSVFNNKWLLEYSDNAGTPYLEVTNQGADLAGTADVVYNTTLSTSVKSNIIISMSSANSRITMFLNS